MYANIYYEIQCIYIINEIEKLMYNIISYMSFMRIIFYIIYFE